MIAQVMELCGIKRQLRDIWSLLSCIYGVGLNPVFSAMVNVQEESKGRAQVRYV